MERRPTTLRRITRRPPLKLNTRTILTEGLIREFILHVKDGQTIDAVCDFLGVWSSTFWDWTKKGEKFLRGNCEPENHSIYGLFVQEMRRASAVYRFKLGKKLHNSRDWIRAMTILERRDRKNFSRKAMPGGDETDYDPDEKFL